MKVGVVCIFLIATPVAAQTAVDCARITNPDARLSCFDALFKTDLPVSQPGKWEVRETRSALNDKSEVSLRVQSQDRIAGRYGRLEHASLWISCSENTTRIYIVWGGHFMADLHGGGRVDFRIDSRAPTHVMMQRSNDYRALGLWQGQSAIPFVRQLLNGSELYVRAIPLNESRVEARFPIAGLDEAIRPLRAACAW
jgi:type VI secretion system protein VasI